VAPDDAARIRRGDLASLAREFSPRVEVHGEGLVTLDARGLARLFGEAGRLGVELRRAAADRGLPARIAIASTRPAAWLVAHARAGLTVVPAGEEAVWLARLPLQVLEQIAVNGLGPGNPGMTRTAQNPGMTRMAQNPGMTRTAQNPGMTRMAWRAGDHGDVEQAVALLAVLKRWGVKTLGEFTALPAAALSERLGQPGLAWQRLARGDEPALLVPDEPEERFEEALDLEWPIEGLQPLSFVLARLCDALSAHLAARDRAAAVLHVYLRLVTRETEHRALQLPAPMRESRVLRTLALLHLESHPVQAGIDRVTVVADPVPGRVLQASLLAHALPVPEQLSTLLARLGAVMGEARCGMAALVDSHRPGAFAMTTFTVPEWQATRGRPRSAPRDRRDAGPTGSPSPFDSAHGAPSDSRGADLRGSASSPRPERAKRVEGRTSEPPDLRTSVVRQAHHALSERSESKGGPSLVLRRFRWPIPASVAVQDGRPVRVATNRQGLRGGRVTICAGPWRTSGEWWCVADVRVQDGEARVQVGWNRDEWDVMVEGGEAYRVYRDRDRDRWFVDAVID
jgi:hypothetical protein